MTPRNRRSAFPAFGALRGQVESVHFCWYLQDTYSATLTRMRNDDQPDSSPTDDGSSRSRRRPRGEIGHRRNRLRDMLIFKNASELRLSHAELGRKHGLSADRISQIVRAESERLADELADGQRGLAARQTAALFCIAREAMDAWRESKQPQRTITRRVPGEGALRDGGGSATETKRNQAGDPRLLDIGMKALADIRKIWGAEAPQKVDLSGTIEIDDASARLDAVTSELERLLPSVLNPRSENSDDAEPGQVIQQNEQAVDFTAADDTGVRECHDDDDEQAAAEPCSVQEPCPPHEVDLQGETQHKPRSDRRTIFSAQLYEDDDADADSEDQDAADAGNGD